MRVGKEADGQRMEKSKIQSLFPVISAKSSRSSGERPQGCETWKWQEINLQKEIICFKTP